MSASLKHNLDDELQAIEIQLAQLTPRAMSGDMLVRMEQLMGQWGEPEIGVGPESLDSAQPVAGGDLTDLEVHLDGLSPALMSDELLTRMSEAMDRWQEQDTAAEKVVPFQKANHQPTRHFFSRGMLSAAAAVAVMGAVTALVMPRMSNSPDGETLAAGGAAPTQLSEGFDNSAFGGHAASNRVLSGTKLSNPAVAPANWVKSAPVSHKVTSTRDSGVIYSADNTPHRCIRIDYIDKIKVRNNEGCEIEIKKPGVNYMLIPVETN